MTDWWGMWWDGSNPGVTGGVCWDGSNPEVTGGVCVGMGVTLG